MSSLPAVISKPTGIIDVRGNPIIREVMTARLSQATTTGVRQAVGPHVTGGLDPQGLADILRGAEDGDPEQYLALAEEMEEKEPHYLSVLGTRKRQVSQLDKTVQPGTSDAEGKKLADAVQEQFLDSDLIDDALFDILDAVGKGFSLHELMWDTEGSQWWIDSLEFVDPRFLRFDRATRRIPLLRANNDNGIGLPLLPHKFLFQEIKAKSGIVVRSGFARPVSWIWMFKNFAVKDWVQFAEIYGMPLRVGEYAPGASEDDKAELLRAVSAISSDAAAVIPQNMKINFQETGASKGGDSVYDPLVRFFDEQTSKMILGQTGTTDSTPGKLGGAPDHTQVREDIERADAKALMATINRQLVRPWVDLNHGPPASGKYPYLWIGRPEPKNAALMVDTAAKLLPYGFKVSQSNIREAVGYDEPQATDELLTAPTAAAPGAPSGGNVPLGDLKNFDLNALKQRVDLLTAEIAQADAVDRATAEQLANWKPLVGGIEQAISEAGRKAGSYEEFKQLLAHRGVKLDVNALADRLARLTFAAFAKGRLGQSIKE
jgi:phage gp29-like protein